MTVYVRRNIYSLDPNGPEIASLRQGVQAMQARSMDDPTSWMYQACIHGAKDPPPPGAMWNQCQHGSFFFLSWHRMFVYWFERILRAASGAPNLTLPYWNYSEVTQRVLPEVFRQPTDDLGNANPLYVAQRGPQINDGRPLDSTVVDYSIAFSYTNFFETDGSGLSFGGQQVSEPVHGQPPSGQLENQPHGDVHVHLGGWMGDLDAAAKDPIFWLHHANIDRLWKRWLDQGGGRSNPTDDNVWMNYSFTFYDEGGNQVQMSAKDILDTVNQLGYGYDDDPPNVPTPPFAHEVGAKALMAAASPSGFSTVLAATIGGNMIELGTQPVKVAVQMDDTTHNKVAAMAAANVVRSRIALNLEGIDYDQNPGVSYEVYINLPEGREPDYRSQYYAGNLSFFGMKPHIHGGQATLVQGQPGGKRSFDITGIIRALQLSGEWQGRQIEVTFVMRGLLPPALAQATATPQPTPLARIQRITITTV